MKGREVMLQSNVNFCKYTGNGYIRGQKRVKKGLGVCRIGWKTVSTRVC